MLFLTIVAVCGFSLSASDVNSDNADNKRLVLLTGQQIREKLLFEMCSTLSFITGAIVMAIPHSNEPCIELQETDNGFNVYASFVKSTGEKEVKMMSINQYSSKTFDFSVDTFKGVVTINDDQSVDCRFEGLKAPATFDVNAIKYALLRASVEGL